MNTWKREVTGSEAGVVCGAGITLKILGDQYIGYIKGDQYILFSKMKKKGVKL